MSVGDSVVRSPDHLDLPPALRARGTVRLPGSKSITLRALLLAGLAEGVTTLEGVLESDDSAVMLDALGDLGVRWAREALDAIRVEGAGGPFKVKNVTLFVGNSGVSTRSLVAALAFCGGNYDIDGVPRMRERPIRDLVDGLRRLGADIRYIGVDGYPPLHVGPGRIDIGAPVRVRGDVSSQFLTGILQGLPLAGRAVTVEVEGSLVSAPYIAITLAVMAAFGVDVEHEDWSTFRIQATPRYRSPGRYAIEGDASGASYLLAAGAISGPRGGCVRVQGVGRRSIQGDVKFVDALRRMGATVRMGDDWLEATAGSPLVGIDIDCTEIPDAAMTLAAAALFARGRMRLTGIGSWRVKETDRIAAMATELGKLGARVEAGRDWLAVDPPKALVPATIDTYDDHRIAMCFALASLGGVPVRINDPGCVGKTYPAFFSEFQRLVAP